VSNSGRSGRGTVCIVVFDTLLARRSGAAFAGMATLIVVTASFVIWRRSGQKLEPDTNEPSKGVADLPPKAPAENEAILAAAVLTEVSLAVEHIQSIQVLLGISRAHQQPIPNAVFGNLDLVRKRLDEVQRWLSPESSKQRQALPLTSNEYPPTCPTPLHPPRLSLEYRASPSDT
jgi:hypothetical protein